MKEILQDQLVATRRAHILEAAATVFAEKGFHATTIKDVARAAGVADGTIYNYFENKDALLLGMFDRMTQAARRNIEPVPLEGLDLRSFIKIFITHPLTAFESDNFELFRVVVSEIMVNKELGQRFSLQILGPMVEDAEHFFRQWAEQNDIPPASIQLTMRAISSMIIGLIVQRVMGDETLVSNWKQLPDALTDLLVDGMGGNRS